MRESLTRIKFCANQLQNNTTFVMVLGHENILNNLIHRSLVFILSNSNQRCKLSASNVLMIHAFFILNNGLWCNLLHLLIHSEFPLTPTIRIHIPKIAKTKTGSSLKPMNIVLRHPIHDHHNFCPSHFFDFPTYQTSAMSQ